MHILAVSTIEKGVTIMKKLMKALCLTMLLLSITLPVISIQASPMRSKENPVHTKSQCALHEAERRLWMDHVSWTRNYIVSAIASQKDQNDVLERLLRNQDDIGNSIKPYYGEEAGKQLTTLLREHIQLAGQVLDAAKNNNSADLDKYNTLWYENADKIAVFLSSANPHYSEKELKNMLHQHLQFVTDQVVARLKNDWPADMKAYEKGEDHMVHFADILADGIIAQFPEKFKK